MRNGLNKPMHIVGVINAHVCVNCTWCRTWLSFSGGLPIQTDFSDKINAVTLNYLGARIHNVIFLILAPWKVFAVAPNLAIIVNLYLLYLNMAPLFITIEWRVQWHHNQAGLLLMNRCSFCVIWLYFLIIFINIQCI